MRKQRKKDCRSEKDSRYRMRDVEKARKESLLVRKRDYANNGRH